MQMFAYSELIELRQRYIVARSESWNDGFTTLLRFFETLAYFVSFLLVHPYSNYGIPHCFS